MEQSNGGGNFGFRSGNWKLVPNGKGKGTAKAALYDLATDLGETTSVADKHPEVVKDLTELLNKTVAKGIAAPKRK